MKEAEKREKGILDPLLAQLVDAKREFLGKDFVPDANGTLRLTHGRVRGYSPADAVLMEPFTTLGGMAEKHAAHPGHPDYDAPQKLLDLAAARDHGPYAHPELGDVPVAMLYDMDTTGGNSGIAGVQRPRRAHRPELRPRVRGDDQRLRLGRVLQPLHRGGHPLHPLVVGQIQRRRALASGNGSEMT